MNKENEYYFAFFLFTKNPRPMINGKLTTVRDYAYGTCVCICFSDAMSRHVNIWVN